MPSFRDDFDSIEEYEEAVMKARKTLWDNLDGEGRKIYFAPRIELSFREKKKIENENKVAFEKHLIPGYFDIFNA